MCCSRQASIWSDDCLRLLPRCSWTKMPFLHQRVAAHNIRTARHLLAISQMLRQTVISAAPNISQTRMSSPCLCVSLRSTMVDKPNRRQCLRAASFTSRLRNVGSLRYNRCWKPTPHVGRDSAGMSRMAQQALGCTRILAFRWRDVESRVQSG